MWSISHNVANCDLSAGTEVLDGVSAIEFRAAANESGVRRSTGTSSASTGASRLPAGALATAQHFSRAGHAGYWGSINCQLIDTFTTIINNDPNVPLDIYNWVCRQRMPTARSSASPP